MTAGRIVLTYRDYAALPDDSDAHGVECYTLGEYGYALTAWLTGDQTLNAAPFPDLALPIASLWA
jgi:hypothetical protein